MSASLSTPTVGLGDFIRQHNFIVPPHQRDYSWSKDYVQQFLDDIERAFVDRVDAYFFGLMVFTTHETGTRLNVIDGQQRLATTEMLISAIRNWMMQIEKLSDDGHTIADRYLGEKDLLTKAVEDKILLNTANRDLFSQLVIGRTPIAMVEALSDKTKRSDRNKALLEAIIQVNRYVTDKVIGIGDIDKARDFFVGLITYIHKNVQVVSLIPGGEDAAYTIFETLNDRGLALAPLDLVKNRLFSRAESYQKGSLTDMQSRWDEMMTILERTKIKSFLRAYWASRYALKEGPELFAAFKTKFKTPEEAYQASIEMRQVAENYAALGDPKDVIWSTYSPEASERVDALTIIGGTQLYPLILSALEKFDAHQMQRLLHLIEVIVVRFQMVARGRPGRMESLGSQVARKIFDGSITTAAQARTELVELYPPDEDFKRGFATLSESDNKTQRYLLRMLEQRAQMKDNPRHWDEAGPQLKTTVEHIMSKALTPVLKAALGPEADKHAEYVNRIGNLCLLGEGNKKLGDLSFKDKIAHYEGSPIITTKMLARYSQWTFDQIEERQKVLAELAVQAWRFQ